MKISVILSTYNAPEWLTKTLWGYGAQLHRDIEIVVADDGSTGETRAAIDRFRAESGMRIRHVWHEDRGFQKSAILNRAITAAEGDYLIFSDGDCVPRGDFVSVHAAHAGAGRFLSGGYFKLPRAVSEAIDRDDVVSGRFADPRWLRGRGVPGGRKMVKLSVQGWMARLLDRITTTRATWNGHNASGWKSDLIRINGFDERMQYGGQDRELGERLFNAGLRSSQIRHRAVCLHLDHDRPWRTRTSVDKNLSIRRRTRRSRATWTEHGIVKGPPPDSG